MTLQADSTFGDDLAFLRQHTDAIVLQAARGQAQIVVVPQYQGRVMTGTAEGDAGFSFGWVNRAAIASKTVQPHINVYGGADRLWLGPEGGTFSLFFAPGTKEQTLANWQTPALIDTDPWPVTKRSARAVTFSVDAALTNRARTVLRFRLERTVRLHEPAAGLRRLGLDARSGLKVLAYESKNTIVNSGRDAWTRPAGLPSLWILGMLQHGPKTTVVVPTLPGPEAERGAVVRSDYFGEVPPDRLRVLDGTVFFRADGQARGKIGVGRGRARDVCGSWDAERGVLTLVTFNLPADAAKRPYVDSRWKDVPDPYAGDVINAYNDGPPNPGAKPLGPFYELESSSPAAELKPGRRLTHIHRTYHLRGDRSALDHTARKVLGVSLEAIARAL